MKLEELKELGKLLEDKGWSNIKYRKKIPESAGTIDVIASSKGVLKKNLLLIIASDIYDAQIACMIFDGVPKKYQHKVVFLEEGDPFFVADRPKDVLIIDKADGLPLP